MQIKFSRQNYWMNTGVEHRAVVAFGIDAVYSNGTDRKSKTSIALYSAF